MTTPAVPVPTEPKPAQPTFQPAPEDVASKDQPSDSATQTRDDKDTLGEAGLLALRDERRARKDLEKRLQKLEPLERIAAAFGQGDPAKGRSEIEQINERLQVAEARMSEAEQARWRAEVAHAKGMTADQASELRGATREEFEQHADRLLSLFAAAAAAAGPRTPKPDRSQGGGAGSAPANSRDAGLAEARRRFGTKTT